MNANYAILFLNRSKNEMIFRRVLPPATPFHFIIAKPISEIAPVELAKHYPEIEVFSLLPKVQLLLHRQPAITDFALGFLRHNLGPLARKRTILKWFIRVDKKSGYFSQFLS